MVEVQQTLPTKEDLMLRTHPFRVLAVVTAVMIGFFALSAPGADDTSGAWYYISAFGWFGFLISGLILVVLSALAAANALRRRQRV
jgi:membrane-anchored protein YejM (alkaline phosphatase superfamily)